MGRPKKVYDRERRKIGAPRAGGESLDRIATKMRLSKTTVARIVGVGN